MDGAGELIEPVSECIRLAGRVCVRARDLFLYGRE